MLVGQLLDQLGGVDRDIGYPLFVLLEDNTAEARSGGIVDVDDGFFRATYRLKGTFDKVSTSLCQHLDGDIIGDVAVFDQGAHEIKIGL